MAAGSHTTLCLQTILTVFVQHSQLLLFFLSLFLFAYYSSSLPPPPLSPSLPFVLPSSHPPPNFLEKKNSQT